MEIDFELLLVQTCLIWLSSSVRTAVWKKIHITFPKSKPSKNNTTDTLYLTHKVHTIHRSQNLNDYIFNRMPVYCTEGFGVSRGLKTSKLIGGFLKVKLCLKETA